MAPLIHASIHQWDTPRAVGDPRPTVNILQATAIAGVSRRTIYNWVEANKVEFFWARRGVRIYTDSLPRRRVSRKAS